MNELNRIHLNGLRAVEAVGRLGSLRAAAADLGVTVGAVSQQVQKTEKQLGRPLFDRHPRGFQPTAFGVEVLQRLTAGMAELSAAVALARADEGVLTVSAAPVFTGKWLVWRLKSFNERHPDIRVRIDSELALVNPGLSGVDVCIRVGHGDWPGVRATKLLDHRVFPVCSPGLARQLLVPGHLANVPIIRDSGEMFDWSTWLEPNSLDSAVLGDGPVFSDASLCLDAAIAGQGVFLAWETLANDAISMNRLVAPFPDRYPTGIAYWFVTAAGAPLSPRVRAFRDWLKKELAESALNE